MTVKSYFLIISIFVISTTHAQSVGGGFTGTGGGSTAGFSEFQNKLNLGYKSEAQRARKLQVDGSPYLFEEWVRMAVITTKGGEILKIRNVNFDSKRNKIVAKIDNDSIYTFNSLAVDNAVINGKKFENVVLPDNSVIKLYEVIAEASNFKILKDYNTEISGGSSNPMRGTIYSRYVTKENYIILKEDSFEKFSLKKSKILKLLASEKDKVEAYADEQDLSFREEKDVNKIINYFTSL